jgi:hypothetical protein
MALAAQVLVQLVLNMWWDVILCIAVGTFSTRAFVRSTRLPGYSYGLIAEQVTWFAVMIVSFLAFMFTFISYRSIDL